MKSLIFLTLMILSPSCDQMADDNGSVNAGNQVNITIANDIRTITSNGIPNHATGDFPNANNPNSISAQNHSYTMDATPDSANQVTPLNTLGSTPGSNVDYVFGVAINGIPIDPSAAEFFENPNTGELNREWRLEALNANLGTDGNNAHVQPTGAYHYHGTPTAIVDGSLSQHSSLLGYAADGFPIYYKYVYSNAMNSGSGIIAATSSYRLKSGSRPGNGTTAPNGSYDGTYVQDYEYVAGLGTLDDCNGRFGVTPEYPNGTYYYVITDDFPFIPRFFRGTPDSSFKLGPPGGIFPPPFGRQRPPRRFR